MPNQNREGFPDYVTPVLSSEQQEAQRLQTRFNTYKQRFMQRELPWLIKNRPEAIMGLLRARDIGSFNAISSTLGMAPLTDATFDSEDAYWANTNVSQRSPQLASYTQFGGAGGTAPSPGGPPSSFVMNEQTKGNWAYNDPRWTQPFQPVQPTTPQPGTPSYVPPVSGTPGTTGGTTPGTTGGTTAPTTGGGTTGGGGGALPNLYQQWYEETPTAQYFNVTSDWGQTPYSQAYWQTQQAPLYSQYIGGLGSAVTQGQQPKQTFDQFLQGYNRKGRWEGLSSYQRGRDERRFSPKSRWLDF